jgi:uncharacterized membrane protein
MPSDDSQGWRVILRWLAAIGFSLAGANHFRHAEFYCRIVPPGLGPPGTLVALSGACEIAGGIGLLIPPLRRAAGWGLIALLVAVFPANIFMALSPQRFADLHIAPWLLWIRLPLQLVFIAIVWVAALAGRKTGPR